VRGPLRIFVEVACELDPELTLRVDRATGEALADDGDLAVRVCPAGCAAIDLALELGVHHRQTAVFAFSLGEGHREALVDALARGAHAAIEVIGGAPEAVPPAALAEWLAQRGADLVIMGRLAGPVAACRGWAHLAGLDRLALCDQGLRAERCLGRGDREQVEAGLPAAVRIESPVRPRYLARARLAAARRRPIDDAELPDLARGAAAIERGGLAPARARTRLGTAPPVPARPARGSERLQALLGLGVTRPASVTSAAEEQPSTPEAMAESFVRYLAHHHLTPDLPDR
jgi:electron transfer flavoprotein alpha/beta subunit